MEILSQVIRQQTAGNTANYIDFPSSLKKNCESYGKARKVIGYYIRFRIGATIYYSTDLKSEN